MQFFFITYDNKKTLSTDITILMGKEVKISGTLDSCQLNSALNFSLTDLNMLLEMLSWKTAKMSKIDNQSMT